MVSCEAPKSARLPPPTPTIAASLYPVSSPPQTTTPSTLALHHPRLPPGQLAAANKASTGGEDSFSYCQLGEHRIGYQLSGRANLRLNAKWGRPLARVSVPSPAGDNIGPISSTSQEGPWSGGRRGRASESSRSSSTVTSARHSAPGDRPGVTRHSNVQPK